MKDIKRGDRGYSVQTFCTRVCGGGGGVVHLPLSMCVVLKFYHEHLTLYFMHEMCEINKV